MMTQFARHFQCVLSAALILTPALSAANPLQSVQPPASVALSVPLEQATNVKAQPLLLLSQFPMAGPSMARFVAKALAKEPAAIDAVLSIIPDTSPEQASAIGAGIVRAMRLLGGESSDVIRSLTYKVMQSDNKWLKTTFSAIGPRATVGGGGGAGFAAALTPYPRVGQTGSSAGASIGARLEADKGIVGPATVTNLTGFSFEKRPLNGIEAIVNANLVRYGMIVAIIKSDAPSNGVVSTSPTI